MKIIRQNTDYALRAMLNLAKHYGQQAVPTRLLAKEEDISLHFAAKILQKLHNAQLVSSSMGPKGGFYLTSPPSKISILEIIEAIQGSLNINTCLLGKDSCSRQKTCPITGKLKQLQGMINNFLNNIMLDELLQQIDESK